MDKLDLKLLELLGKNCRLSNSTIAKALNLSKDTVRNRIKNLKNNKIITHYNTILDIRKLGINKFHMLIKLRKDISNNKEIIGELKKNESISFMNSFVGKYDLQLIIDAKDNHRFEVIKKEILESIGKYVEDYFTFNFIYDIKHSNLIPDVILNTKFEKKLDSSFSSLISNEIYLAGKEGHVQIDDLDFKILKILCNNPRITLVEMSNILEFNRETIKQRIIKLIKNKVIINFGINISFYAFDYVTYFMLIKTKEDFEKTKFDNFRSIPDIFYCAKVQGNYSIILYLLAKSPKKLKETINKVQEEIGKSILDLELHIFDEIYLYTQFPNGIKDELNLINSSI